MSTTTARQLHRLAETIAELRGIRDVDVADQFDQD